jgi:uncharacterized surface protein with fasciclin (FAS1) repeats
VRFCGPHIRYLFNYGRKTLGARELSKAIKDGHGKAELNTVSGGKLWASMQGKNIILTDEKGDTANVTISNVSQSNGVIHVIDTVLLPN